MCDCHETYNPVLKEAVMNVVDNQIRNNNPPQTRQTYNRLVAEGHSKKEAKRLIACVVSSEIFDMLKKHEEFNEDRFVKALNKLPEMPWEGE